jgi:hypothetical protein
MKTSLPNPSAQSAMGTVDLGTVMPPYAPLVMPKQALEADVSLFSYVTAPLRSLLKPSFRSAS